MFRILLFIFLAFLCWLAIRVLAGSRKRDDDASGASAKPDVAPVAKSVESITQCAWCGVHVPHGELVSLPDGRGYCSQAHRDAARQAVAPIDRNRP